MQRPPEPEEKPVRDQEVIQKYSMILVVIELIVSLVSLFMYMAFKLLPTRATAVSLMGFGKEGIE